MEAKIQKLGLLFKGSQPFKSILLNLLGDFVFLFGSNYNNKNKLNSDPI